MLPGSPGAAVIHPLIAIWAVVLVLLVGFLLFLKLVAVMERDQHLENIKNRKDHEGQ